MDEAAQTPKYKIPSAKTSSQRIQAAVTRLLQALTRHSECRSRILNDTGEEDIPWQYIVMFLVDKHPENLAQASSEKLPEQEKPRSPSKGRATKSAKGGQKGVQKGKSEEVRMEYAGKGQ